MFRMRLAAARRADPQAGASETNNEAVFAFIVTSDGWMLFKVWMSNTQPVSTTKPSAMSFRRRSSR